MRIKLNQVDEGVRFRKDYGDLTSLTDSIKRLGLIQPIVITKDNKLVAGGRRLRACQTLNLPEIDAIYLDDVPEVVTREIELEENVHRQELSWQERAALTNEIHRLKQELYGSPVWNNRPETPGKLNEAEPWTIAKTATALDMGTTQTSKYLIAARALEVMPELADESDMDNALLKVKHAIRRIERELLVREARKAGRFVDSTIVCADARDYLKTLPTNSIDLIVTDPPYDVGMKSRIDAGQLHPVHFKDTNTLKTLNEVCKELRRVLKPEGHLYMFTAFYTLWDIFEILEANGFTPDRVPLSWCKNMGGLVAYDKRYVPATELIVFCPTDRTISKQMFNYFIVNSPDPKGRYNMVQKPVDLCTIFIEQSSHLGEVVLDPFAGSGSTLVAAKAAGRVGIGCDDNAEQCDYARLRLSETPEFEPTIEEETVNEPETSQEEPNL